MGVASDVGGLLNPPDLSRRDTSMPTAFACFSTLGTSTDWKYETRLVSEWKHTKYASGYLGLLQTGSTSNEDGFRVGWKSDDLDGWDT